ANGLFVPGFDPRIAESPYEITVMRDGALIGVVDIVGISDDLQTLYLADNELSFTAGDSYFIRPVNLNTRVDESVQVDVLNLYNGASPADEQLKLTENTISGLGINGSSDAASVGITYANLEDLTIQLGSGQNQVDIESTHSGATLIQSQGSDDQFNIKTLAGVTTILSGAGDDTITVSSDEQLVDEIAALLTVDMGGDGNDQLLVDDGGDQEANSLQVNADYLLGLDMPSLAEQQQLLVRAASGTFDMDFGSYGSLTLSYGISGDVMQAVLNQHFGVTSGIEVIHSVSASGHNYSITFGGEIAGLDIPQMIVDTAGLSGDADTSVEASVTTLRDGSATASSTAVQVLRVAPDSGTFALEILGQWTDAIAWNASSDDILKKLQPILNPNNSREDLPHTDNVSVIRAGNTWLIRFQGEHSQESITAVTGEVTLETRVEGISYHGVDVLTIDTGSGDDEINIRSTHADTVTNVNTHVGSDRIDVTSDAKSDLSNQPLAHGTLDGIAGLLNLDAGGDSNALYVSDHDSTSGDSVTLSAGLIQGLAPADITYTASDDGSGLGNFNNDLVIWATQAADL
ncbi:MAG: hypothetical protein VXZ35_08230, partial [Pseudomonadota bacterium]|nr:hypothetical protein [Pseudomonadota bacterium]